MKKKCIHNNELGKCYECGKTVAREASHCNDLSAGNGDNRFCIVVKCKYEVYDTEWAELLMLINAAIENYDGGRLSNVKAMLEEAC